MMPACTVFCTAARLLKRKNTWDKQPGQTNKNLASMRLCGDLGSEDKVRTD